MESEARLADYLATASDWAWESDATHRIKAMAGWPVEAEITPERLIGRRRWEYIGADPLTDPVWRRHLEDLEARRPFRGFVYEFTRPDGAQAWVEVSGNPIFDAEGTFQGYRGTSRDVTERRRAEIALREAHARLEALSHSGMIGIISGRGFIIEEANDAFLDMVGRDRAELEAGGIDWRPMRPPEQREMAIREALEPRETGSFHAVERDYVRPDGRRVPTLLSVVVLDAAEQRWFALVQDLTPMKAAEERVRVLAERDTLTGLANRHVLFEELRRDLQERRLPGATGALLMLDLDNFKEVNDTLGHEAGDRLLQAIGHRLVAVIRDTDTVARIGGDEFAIILRHLHEPAAASVVAQKILDALQRPWSSTATFSSRTAASASASSRPTATSRRSS
jgi:diguanylate cyclase (GGDEF)-like protein/PAS domain S-box-containing protein